MKSIFFKFFILMCLGGFSQTPNKAIVLSTPLEVIGFNYPNEFTLELLKTELLQYIFLIFLMMMC